jgi:hypothetical protein
VQGPRRLPPSWGVVLALVLVAAFPAAPAFAKLPRGYQVTRVDGPDPQSDYRLGDSIVNAGGDIDGDGPDDLLVGIARGGGVKGRVLVLNGIDGSAIREIPAPSDDADGDGTESEGTTGDPDAPTGFGAAVSSIADMGSCLTPAGDPGGAPGENCDTSIVSLADQHTLDDVPEILVSAPGLDLAAESDDRGAVFVIDGATGAILNRIRAPDSEGTADFGFGRSILVPAGDTACAGAGKGGISPCEYGGAAFADVARGDLNSGSRPDIVIGAPDYDETSATNPACSDGAGGGTCSGSGRVYVFYGEALASSPPDQYATNYSVRILNPFAQNDDPTIGSRFWSEGMGTSLAPVGDIGSCMSPPPPGSAPGTPCPQRSLPLDGRPEFTISIPREDFGPIPDAGMAFVVDGATGVPLDIYRPPDPQAESLFGFANYSVPAIGDVGGNDLLPDIYMPAIAQTLQFAAEGRGYLFNGSDQGNQLISTLADPTPVGFGNFGGTMVGVGNVAGPEVGLDNTRKEVLIGNFGSQDTAGGGVSDVSFFSPRTAQALQTIADPDRQPGSGFGRGLAPLGDTNGDGFLDFAAGAGGFDTSSPLRTNGGRIYIFTSDDTPPPAASGSNPPQTTPPPGSTTVIPLAGRTIELEASRTQIRLGAQVTLRGVVEAFASNVRCERNQTVDIQRRRRGTLLYRSLPNRLLPNRVPLSTNRAGTFSLKLRPTGTYYYRARLAQSTYCIGAVSPREQVIVKKKAITSRRQ